MAVTTQLVHTEFAPKFPRQALALQPQAGCVCRDTQSVFGLCFHPIHQTAICWCRGDV